MGVLTCPRFCITLCMDGKTGARLISLIGTWQTEHPGQVICPTGIVEKYGERLVLFQAQTTDDWLHYEHCAWQVVMNPQNEEPQIGRTLHAEYGFIRVLQEKNEQVEATFVMNSGRGEYAQGSVTGDGAKIRLALVSERFINDRRGVLSTRRDYIFDIETGICKKVMQLQTDKVWTQPKLHLQAQLTRLHPKQKAKSLT